MLGWAIRMASFVTATQNSLFSNEFPLISPLCFFYIENYVYNHIT